MEIKFYVSIARRIVARSKKETVERQVNYRANDISIGDFRIFAGTKDETIESNKSVYPIKLQNCFRVAVRLKLNERVLRSIKR